MCVFINVRASKFPPLSEKACKVTAFFWNMQIFLFYFSFLSPKCSTMRPK